MNEADTLEMDINAITTYTFLSCEPVGPLGPMVTWIPPQVDLQDNNSEYIDLSHNFEFVDVLNQIDHGPRDLPERQGARDSVENNVSKNMHCYICNKYFRQLKKHMLSHSGEKPYSCTYCSLSFSQKSNLNRHVKSKHEKNFVFCWYCGKHFKRNDKLKTHIRSAHPDKTPNNPAA